MKTKTVTVTEMTCDKKDCGYTWDYRGKMNMVTCPNCQRKVRRKVIW